jgi:hypothetical protein
MREVIMRYGRLTVFIGHDSVEIWWFRYRPTLGIDTLKVKASSGVFVLIAFFSIRMCQLGVANFMHDLT